MIAASTMVVPHLGHGAVVTTAFDNSIFVSSLFISSPWKHAATLKATLSLISS